MARNKLAGTKKGKSKSAKYFQENPLARKKKDDYNKKYHSTDERRRYRVELNRANRLAGEVGKGNGTDMSHTKGGKMTLEKQSANRARNGKGNNKRLK